MVLDRPHFVDEATLPKIKDPEEVPHQLVFNFSISLFHLNQLRATLARFQEDHND